MREKHGGRYEGEGGGKGELLKAKERVDEHVEDLRGFLGLPVCQLMMWPDGSHHRELSKCSALVCV